MIILSFILARDILLISCLFTFCHNLFTFLFSSTRIDLPESGNDSDVITITGRKENVEKAKTKIAQIQSEMANVVSGTYF